MVEYHQKSQGTLPQWASVSIQNTLRCRASHEGNAVHIPSALILLDCLEKSKPVWLRIKQRNFTESDFPACTSFKVKESTPKSVMCFHVSEEPRPCAQGSGSIQPGGEHQCLCLLGSSPWNGVQAWQRPLLCTTRAEKCDSGMSSKVLSGSDHVLCFSSGLVFSNSLILKFHTCLLRAIFGSSLWRVFTSNPGNKFITIFKRTRKPSCGPC